jgi:acyl dehydratase
VLAVPPMLAPIRRLRSVVTTGVLSSATATVMVSVAISWCFRAADDNQLGAVIASGLCVAGLAALATMTTIVRQTRGNDSPALVERQVQAFGAVIVVALTFLSYTAVVLADARLGANASALMAISLAAALTGCLISLRGRVQPTFLMVLAALPALLAIYAVVRVTMPYLHLANGGVLMIIAAAFASSTLLRQGRVWSICAWSATAIALLFATTAPAESLEWYTVPGAIVLFALGQAFRRSGALSSWVVYAPAAAALLIPTAAAGLGDDTPMRSVAVAVVGSIVLALSASRRLQGPTVVSAFSLAVSAVAVFNPLMHHTPVWLIAAASGAALLWVGFRWEANLKAAKDVRVRWSHWS